MNTRPARLFAAVSMTVALAACQKLGGVAGGDNSPKLAVGDTVSGEITSTSSLNYNDGSRHQGYKMALKSGEAVSLELGGALSGQLAVFDGQALLANASSGSSDSESGSNGSSVSLAFRAPKDGTYLVAVNGASAQSFGPFKLKTAQVVPYDGKPLGADSQAIDWLMGDKQEYKLKVDKAGLYSITLESSAFDAYLRLNGRNVEVEDDDSGGQLNARIRTFLEPGEYTIGASSVNSNTGSFKLSVAVVPTPNGMITRDGTSLIIGQPAQAMMDSRGRRTFVLNVDSPRQVQFDAIADSFDSVLKITGPGVDAEDDDGGNGTNAQLILDLRAGRYIVAVSSLGSQPGVFELETTDLGSDVAAPASNRKDAVEAAAEAAADAAAAVIN